MSKRIVTVRKHTKRLKGKIVDEIDDEAEATANKSVKKRLTQTAFASHRGKSRARFTQDHLQRFTECGKQSLAVALVPGQSASRRRGCRSRRRSDHRWRSRSLSRWNRRRGRGGRDILGQFGKLTKWLPARHSLAPPQLAWKKAAGPTSSPTFFPLQCPHTLSPPPYRH